MTATHPWVRFSIQYSSLLLVSCGGGYECVTVVGVEKLEKQSSSPWPFSLFGWDTVGLQLELGSARDAFYSSTLLKEKLFSIVREISSWALSAPIPLLPNGNQCHDGDVGEQVWVHVIKQ